jgi:hypothetical protein
MVAKFLWMLAVGCSVVVAAQHVWYDRFDEEDPRLCDTLVLIHGIDFGRGRTIEPQLSTMAISEQSFNLGADDPRASHSDCTSNSAAHIEVLDFPTLNSFEMANVAPHDIDGCLASRSATGLSVTTGSTQEALVRPISNTSPLFRRSGILPNSGVDRMWRYSIASFLLGALP